MNGREKMGNMENMNFVRKLPIPKIVKESFPISEKAQRIKEERDREIAKIFKGESNKFLLIIGPCSADREEPVLDYISRIKRVQEEVQDKILIIPRLYTNKPRTTGGGYKGMLHQPDPNAKPDVYEGILAIRSLHAKAIEEIGLTCADEMLYPDNHRYISDLLSYVAVGARSVENQEHRLTCSGIDIPCGMKNPTSGHLSVMMNSVIAAQLEHTFLYRGWETSTTGNPLAHTILRGSQNKHGQSIPNYHYEDIMLLNELYEEKQLKNPAVIIDANHSNSNKLYKEQIRICKDVLHSRNCSDVAKKLVKGLMIESYIEEGTQPIGCKDHVYGKSITDPCLGWEDTEKLLYDIADLVM